MAGPHEQIRSEIVVARKITAERGIRRVVPKSLSNISTGLAKSSLHLSQASGSEPLSGTRSN